MTTSDTAVPEPSPEQAALFARVRRMMLIAGLTSALAICAVLIAVGYRLFKSEGRAPEPVGDIIATLPKGAKIVSTGVAGDRLVVTLDIGGVTEIRTFDAHTLKPAGKLKFAANRAMEKASVFDEPGSLSPGRERRAFKTLNRLPPANFEAMASLTLPSSSG